MIDDYVHQLQSLMGEHAKAEQMATAFGKAAEERKSSASPAAAAPSPPQPPQPPPPRAPPAEPPPPVKIAGAPVQASASTTYVPIENFGWDQDEYGKSPSNVYIYLLSGFDGIGACKESVSCDFGRDWFDLKVAGFNGKNYRLVKRNLDKNIDPEASKVLVKKNSIKICLRKARAHADAPARRSGDATLVSGAQTARPRTARVRPSEVEQRWR